MSLGTRLTSRPQLRYKDVCNRDLKALQIESQTRKNTASASKHLRQTVNQEFKQFDVSVAENKTDQMRQRRLFSQAIQNSERAQVEIKRAKRRFACEK